MPDRRVCSAKRVSVRPSDLFGPGSPGYGFELPDAVESTHS